MKIFHERLLMALGLLGLPTLVVLGGILPVLKRSEGLKKEIQALEMEYKDIPRFSKLSMDEKQLLQDPDATWRKRMPVLLGDAARLNHYSRVVGELQYTLRSAGAPMDALRSSWDPIQATFTLEEDLAEITPGQTPVPDSPEYKVQGWVLEANIPGTTEKLFQAMASSYEVHPLLEPVGIRWESTLEKRRQQILYRNLVLCP